MTRTQSQTRFTKDQRDFYVDNLLPHLDQVYRLAFTLTLNSKAARKLTEFVYINLSKDLPQLAASLEATKIKQELVKILYETYSKSKDKSWLVEDSALAELLKSIEQMPRFCLNACDFFGMNTKQLAAVLNLKEEEVLKQLLKGRSQLLATQ
ncbi:MAG: hypothetical protein KBD78_13310 [Oligoflexales bacterium]|nr:hypothetical protein [Oligoflexales bacterium]